MNEEKWIEYAVVIRRKFAEIFDDSENGIDLKDFEDDENIKAFFHAVSTVVPCDIFNLMMVDQKGHLGYNHFANALCFEYTKKKK